MTKKHFEMIANILAASKPYENMTAAELRMQIIELFAVTLSQEYPRFDRHRFIDACEIGG